MENKPSNFSILPLSETMNKAGSLTLCFTLLYGTGVMIYNNAIINPDDTIEDYNRKKLRYDPLWKLWSISSTLTISSLLLKIIGY